MNRRVPILLPLALAIAAVASLLGPVSAPAAPIDDKRAQAAQLEQQITENGRRLDALNEQINSAQLALDEANNTITAADALVAAANQKTNDLRSELAQRAAAVYRHAGTGDSVAALDTLNASDLATRRKYTELAAQREKRLVSDLARAKEDLAVRKTEAEQARTAAETQKQAIETVRNEVAAGDAKQRALLAKVNGEIATLVQQAETARRAREAAAAAALVTSNAKFSKNIPAPSPKAAIAIAYAQAQLGKPYCYAGVGPECYDCSGLTMMAWGAAGVAMPHGSTEQYNMFPHVPLSQAQPGDLIAWNGHVGLYIGGGMMIHAPHTGAFVEIAPLYGTPWGAARPG
jgi:cell wall-associated NlpC family hydrolase